MDDSEEGSSEARRAHQEWAQYETAANQSAVDLASATLKALLLLNGGAAISMLGFVASITSGPISNDLDLGRVVCSLQAYALGAGLAVLATGASYIVMFMQAWHTQSYERVERQPYIVKGPRTNTVWKMYFVAHALAVLIPVASLCAFGAGVWVTGDIVTAAVQSK